MLRAHLQFFLLMTVQKVEGEIVFFVSPTSGLKSRILETDSRVFEIGDVSSIRPANFKVMKKHATEGGKVRCHPRKMRRLVSSVTVEKLEALKKPWHF